MGTETGATPSGPTRGRWAWTAALMAAAVLAFVLLRGWFSETEPEPPRERSGAPPAAVSAFETEVRRFCSQHHGYTPPELFAQHVWVKQIDRMYEFGGSPLAGGPSVPPRDQVLAFFQAHAPAEAPHLRGQAQRGPGPLRFRRRTYTPVGAPPTPAVSHVRWIRRGDSSRSDLVYCDMRHGRVARVRFDTEDPQEDLLLKVPHPGRATPVDLDRDGALDLLISDLGSFDPADHDRGQIIWLRAQKEGGFAAIPLAQKLARVADTQAVDLDGDGDLDLAAAVFGFRKTGGVLFLRNSATELGSFKFTAYTLDPRPGALQVPIVDLDRDGRPDVVTALAQEFETVEAILNRGPSKPFEPKTIWTAPHPALGSAGIEIADLDGDGDLDAIHASGDTLDSSQLVPWQGVRWLENRGGFPFAEKLFEQLPGCHGLRVVDLDGDGDLDIVASAFLPTIKWDEGRRAFGLESIIWLEQVKKGEFARHSLESLTCDFATLDVADFDGDGDQDIALGNFALIPDRIGTIAEWIVVLENVTKG